MRNLSKEEIYKKIKLTKKQKEAWVDLNKALDKCKKSNILFYNVLETLSVMNGNNVDNVYDDDGKTRKQPNIFKVSNYIIPSRTYMGIDGFSDDGTIHYIKFKD